MNLKQDIELIRQLKNKKQTNIKRAILKHFALTSTQLETKLESLITKHGRVVRENQQETQDWLKAFDKAEDWNSYMLKNADSYVLDDWINKKEVICEKGVLKINQETWFWLACLAHLKAKAKESPNHFLLKYLVVTYLKNHLPTVTFLNEVRKEIFHEKIRFDLMSESSEVKVVAEVGGVQTWKVMAALEKGYMVYVLPHWTRNKSNLFGDTKLSYEYYLFRKGGDPKLGQGKDK